MEKVIREARDVKIAVERASGRTCREIGKRYNLSRQMVSEICQRGDVKSFIEEVTKSLALNEGMDSYKNIAYAIKSYRSKKTDGMEEKDRLQLREHGFKASTRVLESLGVLESQKSSISIQNITNTQNNIVSPMMADLIKKHLGIGQTIE